MQIINCIQGTDEWIVAKLGVVSSSNFSKVLNKGAGRKLYMRKLTAERLSGVRDESYSNKCMADGIELEPDARAFYERVNSCIVEQVGFIKKDDWIGSSPDGLVGKDGGIEIKCVIPSTQVETILRGAMQTGYKPQVQGQLYVTDRKWIDWISYCPLLKARPYFCVRVYRDEEYIKDLSKVIDVFVEQLKDMISQITKPEF